MTTERVGDSAGTGADVPAAGRVIDDVVVLSTATPPAWVERWCRASGRRVRRMPVPSIERIHARMSKVEVAAASAGAASAVLLLHGPLEPDDEGAGVAVAVKELPDDTPILNAAAECAAVMDADLVVLHAVPTSFAEHSVGLDEALDRGDALLAEATHVAHRAAPQLAVTGRLVRALPHEVVGEGLHSGLLVIGGPRPGTDGALGLVALSAMNHAPCPVLLVARDRH